MKKLITMLSVAAVLAFAGCSKDDDNSSGSGNGSGNNPPAGLTVEKKNRGVLIDFSEDWCPPCGSYGGPSFDSCLTQEGTLISALKVYGSSNNSALNSDIADAWATAFGVSSIPKFFLNNTNQGVTTNIGYNYSGVIQKANAFAADTVIAGVNMSKTITGDTMSVTTRVKFFKADTLNTPYSLGIYVVEDLVISQQSTSSGSDPNYEHRNLLRVANASIYTGTPINNSAKVNAEQQFDATFKMGLKSTWNKSNLKVVAIIWKTNASPAKVINSFMIK